VVSAITVIGTAHCRITKEIATDSAREPEILGIERVNLIICPPELQGLSMQGVAARGNPVAAEGFFRKIICRRRK
jgi:hypothetical protein